MNPLNGGKINEIVDQIGGWPAGDRLTLVQKILGTLGPDLAPTRPKRRSLRNLVGLLKRDGPPPSDEEIALMLDEEIMGRYGS